MVHLVPARQEALAWRLTDGIHVSSSLIQEALDGKLVDWMEKVSDEEYQTAVAKAG